MNKAPYLAVSTALATLSLPAGAEEAAGPCVPGFAAPAFPYTQEHQLRLADYHRSVAEQQKAAAEQYQAMIEQQQRVAAEYAQTIAAQQQAMAEQQAQWMLEAVEAQRKLIEQGVGQAQYPSPAAYTGPLAEAPTPPSLPTWEQPAFAPMPFAERWTSYPSSDRGEWLKERQARAEERRQRVAEQRRLATERREAARQQILEGRSARVEI